MSTSHFYHTQGMRGFKLKRMERINGTEIACITSTSDSIVCLKCRSSNISIIYTGKTRDIRGLSIGLRRMVFRVQIRRVRCHECGSYAQEPISFCPGQYARITKYLARYVLALRSAMSISDTAHFTGLHWDTVKNIEKAWLEKKYKRIRLNQVSILGIDEVYLGKKLGYITVVRDIESGAVLYIGKGKGGDALKKFRKRIKRKAAQIVAVTMDMSNAYSAWVSEVLPNADIIYDHFHVIKLMNDRMDNLRRITMNKLADEQKKELKGKRYLLLRNEENLSTNATAELKKLRFEFADLGTASMMKEYLRNIYKMADSCDLARTAFLLWCEKAEASGIGCLKQMARTIRKRLQGLLAFWLHNRITSASQEGFNNKIGWLTRQAYGYRDEEYLILKIYDLPHLDIRKRL